MREQEWQVLIRPVLAESLGIPPECLHAEVPTRDGSICDLVAFHRGRIIAFELKMADLGEVSTSLGSRGTRQLRHYALAADEVWLITVGSPRAFHWVDACVVVEQPLERQLCPPGVGWAVFDQLSRHLTVLAPPSGTTPNQNDRLYLVDAVLARLAKAQRAAQECRV